MGSDKALCLTALQSGLVRCVDHHSHSSSYMGLHGVTWGLQWVAGKGGAGGVIVNARASVHVGGSARVGSDKALCCDALTVRVCHMGHHHSQSSSYMGVTWGLQCVAGKSGSVIWVIISASAQSTHSRIIDSAIYSGGVLLGLSRHPSIPLTCPPDPPPPRPSHRNHASPLLLGGRLRLLDQLSQRGDEILNVLGRSLRRGGEEQGEGRYDEERKRRHTVRG